MKKELEQKFYDRWPDWFAGRFEGKRANLMCFGFDHGDGWFDLEWRLCEDLEKILGDTSYKLVQIKEKFGTLRWYDNGAPEELYTLVHMRIRQAENESAKTCEVCGKPGETDYSRSWVTTRCSECKKA